MSVPLFELKIKRTLDKNANLKIFLKEKYDFNLTCDIPDSNTRLHHDRSICVTTTRNGLNDIRITNSLKMILKKQH